MVGLSLETLKLGLILMDSGRPRFYNLERESTSVCSRWPDYAVLFRQAVKGQNRRSEGRRLRLALK